MKTFIGQLNRYFVSATIAFVIDFTSLIFFTEIIGIFYLHSVVLAFTLGVITNYTININWVFSERRINSASHEFYGYLIIVFFGLVINIGIIWFLTEKLKIFYAISKLFSTAMVFWWNFLMKKFFLFSGSQS